MDATRHCPSCQKPLAPNVPMGLCPECLIKAAFPTGVETDTGSAKQPAFVPPTVEEIAKLFPQLGILELVGKGGMGAVYKAWQKRLNRFVALKILPPGIGSKPAFAERFTREAQALAQLNHPGIVTLYEFGETSGLFYFLMEFVDGVNLRQLLARSRISAREALAIVPQICDALQYAHDQGIIHRDIKPENILLDRHGRVKVADFGLAKLVGTGNEPQADERTAAALPELTESGKIMGTPNYMAPEQMEHPTEVDHRADIYALGVVFYQMLTGELPGKKLEPPSRKVQIDVRLDEVVLRALEKKPEMRYQQASVLKTQVETIATSAAAEKNLRQDEEAPSFPKWLLWRIGLPKRRAQMGTAVATPPIPVIGVRDGRRVFYWPGIVLRILGPLVIIALLAFLTYALGESSKVWFYIGMILCIWTWLRCIMEWVKPIERLPRLDDSSTDTPTPAPPPSASVPAAPASAPAKTTQPRVRFEIAGANLAPIFFIVALLKFAVRHFEGPWPFDVLPLLDLLGTPIALFGAVATTVLGWIAVAQIRRSVSPPLGLGLAVFDGLLFPLLVFDGVIGLVSFIFGDSVAIHGETLNHFLFYGAADLWSWLVLTIGLIAMAWVDYLIARNIWRAVSKPQAGIPVPRSAQVPQTPPRFSRTAIVGAWWVPSGLVVLLLFSWSLQEVSVSLGNSGPPVPGQNWLGLLIGLPVALLGLTAPFGTTILGWVAVTQIRRSAGRLYGLWLAVLDGLLFPLLALDGLLVAVGLITKIKLDAQSGIVDPHLSVSFWEIVAPGLSLLAFLDWLIIRAVWRAVNKMLPTPAPSVGKPGRFGKLALALCLGGLVLGVVFHLLPAPAERPPMAVTWIYYLPLFCGIAAIALGIIGWKSRAGKAAVMVMGLLLIADLLTFSFLNTPGGDSEARIESVVVSVDKAVVKQRNFHGEGMSVMFGPMTYRWEPGSLYYDSMFDVTLEWPWFNRHGANWVFKSRHGTYSDYRLDGPSGPMLGKIVFHPGKPAPDADGFYVIAEFRRDMGDEAAAKKADASWVFSEPQPGGSQPIPIAVRLATNGPVPPPPTANATAPRLNLDVLRVQIRQAEAELARLKELAGPNLVPATDVDAAQDKLDILKAELDGDEIKVAQIRLDSTQRALKHASDLFNAKIIPASDFEAAKAEVEMRQAELRAAQAIQGTNVWFGPVMERVVNNDGTNSLIDLDSGRLFTPPPGGADWNWQLTNGIDAFGDPANANFPRLLATSGTVVVTEPVNAWENSSASDVRRVATPLSPTTPGGIVLDSKGELPVTFIFRTREGGMGLLQVLAQAENPRGVKIRYKLVQSAANNNLPMVAQPDSSPNDNNVGPSGAAARGAERVSWFLVAVLGLGLLLFLAVLVTALVLAVKKWKSGAGKAIAIGCAVLVLGGFLILALVAGVFFFWRAGGH